MAVSQRSVRPGMIPVSRACTVHTWWCAVCTARRSHLPSHTGPPLIVSPAAISLTSRHVTARGGSYSLTPTPPHPTVVSTNVQRLGRTGGHEPLGVTGPSPDGQHPHQATLEGVHSALHVVKCALVQLAGSVTHRIPQRLARCNCRIQCFTISIVSLKENVCN